MHLAQVVLPLILGLVVISWQHVQADEILGLKGNSSKPVNRTVFGEDKLYMAFACRGKTNGLRLPIAGSCVDYYQCEHGAVNRLTCDDGKLFSSLALTCMDAHLSKCVQEEMDDMLVECEGPCCSREDGLYPVEGICSDFIVCVNGYTVQKSCGGLLEFSADKLICDIPSRAGCSNAVIVEENQVVEEEEEKESEIADSEEKPKLYKISHRVCHNKPNGVSIPIFGSCNKFYVCISGIGYLKSCGNLQFNPNGYCDLKTRMHCPADEEDVVILEEEFVPIDTRPLPVIRPKPLPVHPVEDNVDSPPYPEDMETQKEETNNEQSTEIENEKEEIPMPPIAVPRPPVAESLPEEEEHFTETKPQPPVVDEENDQEHAIETKPTENEDGHIPENRPRPPIAVPKPPVVLQPESEDQVPASVKNVCFNQSIGTLMAMPENCSKYIRCRWDWFEKRVAEVMSCPEDMHFNAKTKQCDTPADAGCIVYSKKTKKALHKKKRNKFTLAF